MKTGNFLRVNQFIILSVASALPQLVSAQVDGGKDFNGYVLKAVEVLNKNYAARGYANSSYTHELKYGPDNLGKPAPRIKPSNPPYTMCVAAVAEVIITALNLYMEDPKTDPATVKKILNYLPPEGWTSMRPQDIRSHLWVDPHLKASGTADALSTFGIGNHADFPKLRPGAFVNVNRLNNSGHAVVFLGYIDREGKDVPVYGPTVAGFRYFSSQGKKYSAGSGFGYRWAFFLQGGKKYCPVLGSGRKVDCGIIHKEDQVILNTGYMLLPQYWDVKYRDENLKRIANNIYDQDYSKGPTKNTLGLPANLTKKQFLEMLNKTNTMQLNSKYENQDMPDD